jgi:hypothetical protein
MFTSLKRAATGAARHLLFAGAVALLLVSWGGVAQAFHEVPELSPGAIGGAMTLLAGGLLLLRERLRS